MVSRSSNRAAVPEAKSALDRFKYEVASEIGVPLKDGYNGDLTSRQNGSCSRSKFLSYFLIFFVKNFHITLFHFTEKRSYFFVVKQRFKE